LERFDFHRMLTEHLHHRDGKDFVSKFGVLTGANAGIPLSAWDAIDKQHKKRSVWSLVLRVAPVSIRNSDARRYSQLNLEDRLPLGKVRNPYAWHELVEHANIRDD
jgi:hypothetical protein